MADSRYGSLQVCLLRVSELEASGGPAVGADNGFVTESLISVDYGLEYADDVDLEKLNGCGNICQSYFQQGALKRATLDAALCELDIQVAAMTIGGQLFSLTGIPLGWEAPKINDAAPNGVCLEVWTKANDGVGPAVPAALGSDVAWWHWVFPRYKGKLDDGTLENDFSDFGITGFSTENAELPASGPFGDWPDYIADAGGVTAAMGFFLDTNFPDTPSGYVAVTEGAS